MHTAGELRRRLTPAEHKLWALLRNDRLGVSFRRQHAIGPYIVDFCAPRRKFLIEVDGCQHLNQEEYDTQRSAFLESEGYRILRFWNNEVMNDIDHVIRTIDQALHNGTSDLSLY